MSAVVLYGRPTEEIESALLGWGRSVVRAEDGAGAFVDSMRDGFVWLSARTQPDDAVFQEIDAAEASREGRVFIAAHEGVVSEHARIPLGNRIVLAGPGAAHFGVSGPVARRGVEQVRLSHVVRIGIPESVGEHLRAVNDESSMNALAADAGGCEPRLSDLAIAPALVTWRGWRGAVGDRDRAFSAAFLEGFAIAATSAKLWERRHPDQEPGL